MGECVGVPVIIEVGWCVGMVSIICASINAGGL